MGNHISCTLANGGNAKYIKVVLPSNEVRRIEGPTNAAELMLDMPGYFLVCSKSMQVGKRFLPLSADEELEMCCVYVMFPMKRVNAVVAAADMTRLLIVANKEIRRSSSAGGGSRVLPETTGSTSPEVKIVAVSKPKLEDLLKQEAMEEEEVLGASMMFEEYRQRISTSRARRPTLETIQEEVVSSR